MRIDFAIIGFPKCGTTSIKYNLAKCQGIHMLPQEPALSDLPDLEYPDNMLIGLKNPSVIYSWDKWKNILKDSKIIICWRNPVDFLLTASVP